VQTSKRCRRLGGRVTHPLQKTKPQRVDHPGGIYRTKVAPPAISWATFGQPLEERWWGRFLPQTNSKHASENGVPLTPSNHRKGSPPAVRGKRLNPRNGFLPTPCSETGLEARTGTGWLWIGSAPLNSLPQTPNVSTRYAQTAEQEPRRQWCASCRNRGKGSAAHGEHEAMPRSREGKRENVDAHG
jgi:hypothetical protein